MVSVLRKLPFVDNQQQFSVGSVNVTLRPLQIPVWVTVCQQGDDSYDINSPLILAVLDTGYNGEFAIREEQLRSWGGIDPNWFLCVNTKNHSRGKVDVRRANIWLHRNIPYATDASRQDPFHIELDDGIDVFRKPATTPAKDTRPGLPLIGMRALRRTKLMLMIDFRRGCVSLSKPWLFFGPFAL